jgi:hypothetical protein
MYEPTVTPRQRWKAQASAYRAYLRRIRQERESCEYADSPSWAAKQLQRIPLVTAPLGYSRPMPPMHGFGLDRFRVGMSANIWVRKHATRLGIKIDVPAHGWVRGDELADYINRLRHALTAHLAKCATAAVRTHALNITRAAA